MSNVLFKSSGGVLIANSEQVSTNKPNVLFTPNSLTPKKLVLFMNYKECSRKHFTLSKHFDHENFFNERDMWFDMLDGVLQ